MNTFFTQLKNDAEKIRLSESERSLMRASLESAMAHAPLRPKVRRGTRKTLFPKILAVTLSGGLLLGGGVAYAAEGALPGDSLYSVKLGVNEKVLEVVAFSPEAKLSWHERAAERRVEELAVLAFEKRLTPETAQELEVRIEEHSLRGESLAVHKEEPVRAARMAARFAAVRSVARTLSSAALPGDGVLASAADVSLSITASQPVSMEMSSRALVTKAAPAPAVATLSMTLEASDASLEDVVSEDAHEDEAFLSALSEETERTIGTIEKEIRERRVSTTTREEAGIRIERLKTRIEEVRNRRGEPSRELELRDVLERGSELDVALKAEEKADIQIVPRLPR